MVFDFTLCSPYDIAYLVFFKSSQLSSQVFAKHGFASVSKKFCRKFLNVSKGPPSFFLQPDSQRVRPFTILKTLTFRFLSLGYSPILDVLFTIARVTVVSVGLYCVRIKFCGIF